MPRKKIEVVVKTDQVKTPTKRVYKKKTSTDLSASTAKKLDEPVKTESVGTVQNATIDPFDKPERDLGIAAKVFFGIVALLFIYFGWVHNPGPHANNVFLWDAVHPTTVLDVIGSILFLGTCLFLTGVFAKALDTFPKWFPFAVYVAGALGVILIFA